MLSFRIIEIEGENILDVDIALYNILGEVVFSKSNQNIVQRMTIDISSLATGIYLIELNLNGSRVMKKIVKE